MAVDSSRPDATTIPGAGAPPNGSVNGAAAALGKRKRPSSLMKSASQLPTVEHSLEEFIARANQTLVDANTWAQADQQAKEEEARRREQDAQRWKQAELQMRESEAREASLRRQLDGLQGKLAEAEARAAVAISASSSASMAVASQDALADLKAQLEQAQQRLRTAEDQAKRLSLELESARTEAAAPRGTAVAPGDATGDATGGVTDASSAERIRVAERKAIQALAAARAIAVGLTVSPDDLAAIERGLAIPAPAQKSPWPAIMLAFVGGVVLMLVVWKVAPGNDDRAPAAAQAAPTAPAAQPSIEPPQQVSPAPAPGAAPAPATATTPAPAGAPAPAPAPATATPPATATTPASATATAPAPATATAPAAPKPTVTPIPVPTVTPIEEPKPGAAARPEAPKPAPAPAPARKPAKPADKPAGGIVDPF